MRFDGQRFRCHDARPLGRVPKWPKGTDCKSVIRGFKSHRGLQTQPRSGGAVSLFGWDLARVARVGSNPTAAWVGSDGSAGLQAARHPDWLCRLHLAVSLRIRLRLASSPLGRRCDFRAFGGPSDPTHSAPLRRGCFAFWVGFGSLRSRGFKSHRGLGWVGAPVRARREAKREPKSCGLGRRFVWHYPPAKQGVVAGGRALSTFELTFERFRRRPRVAITRGDATRNVHPRPRRLLALRARRCGRSE